MFRKSTTFSNNVIPLALRHENTSLIFLTGAYRCPGVVSVSVKNEYIVRLSFKKTNAILQCHHEFLHEPHIQFLQVFAAVMDGMVEEPPMNRVTNINSIEHCAEPRSRLLQAAIALIAVGGADAHLHDLSASGHTPLEAAVVSGHRGLSHHLVLVVGKRRRVEEKRQVAMEEFAAAMREVASCVFVHARLLDRSCYHTNYFNIHILPVIVARFVFLSLKIAFFSCIFSLDSVECGECIFTHLQRKRVCRDA